jgi:tripartite-type tricarboxylate transporter receptor subunit TctC
MRLPRRTFLRLAACIAAAPALPRIALALDYPVRPVKLVVGFPPGTGPDITARLIGQLLAERFGQSFVIDNRPGAGTNIGTEFVVRSPADGYTLLLLTSTNSYNVTLYRNLNFDYLRDIAPVASIGTVPFLMAVHPSVPVKTVGEFIAYAKANPGKINMASAGNGSAPHVFGELFKMMTGVDLVHVPYRDNYFPDLLAGQTQFVFGPVISTTAYVKSGKLRALAVTTATRLEAWPDLPTVAETVPGFEASGWLGVGVPAHTPDAIIDKLNTAISAELGDAKVKSQLADLGCVLQPMTPSECGKFVATEAVKWAKVIKFADIKAD